MICDEQAEGGGRMMLVLFFKDHLTQLCQFVLMLLKEQEEGSCC
jgi:hypothetical protein